MPNVLGTLRTFAIYFVIEKFRLKHDVKRRIADQFFVLSQQSF